MAPNQNEKKIINEKVAQVREVVDNATNNDIIMVLHTFDLDVNKTIQAFCEDGAASILGDWVTSGGASVASKNKKNKNKKAKASVASSAETVTSTPSTATTPPVQQQKPAKTQTAAPVRQEQPSVNKPAAAPAPASNDPLSVAFKALRTALNDREKQLKAGNQKSLSLDTSALVKSILAFGESSAQSKPTQKPTQQQQQKTVSPPPASAPIKHATSQSSITSSVGADSGVNLSPTHKEEKKAPAKPQQTVVSNGLQMTADGLSQAQLAALQQTLTLQLAARGLDASVLTSSENVVRRPRNNNKNENKKGGNHGKPQQPKLTIL
ncbi:unnamed protein product [Caenorhabditis angaria]|uniref:Uncharacterized protein n=1 Tax=Caenorhabditis angaria TaxID=860376 RepID=A0A9P1MT74_9PELO|nr:unnamed protein product [Caenorhabditis angaria]